MGRRLIHITAKGAGGHATVVSRQGWKVSGIWAVAWDPEADTWAVVHTPTGRNLVTFERTGHAVKLCEALAQVFDHPTGQPGDKRLTIPAALVAQLGQLVAAAKRAAGVQGDG